MMLAITPTILSMLSIVSAQFIPPFMTPDSCSTPHSLPYPPPVTINCAPGFCYTHTVTLPDPKTVCAQFISTTCRPWKCLLAETKTIPCEQTCCPTTPTVTSYKPCQTECSSRCPTMTVSCKDLMV